MLYEGNRTGKGVQLLLGAFTVHSDQNHLAQLEEKMKRLMKVTREVTVQVDRSAGTHSFIILCLCRIGGLVGGRASFYCSVVLLPYEAKAKVNAVFVLCNCTMFFILFLRG